MGGGAGGCQNSFVGISNFCFLLSEFQLFKKLRLVDFRRSLAPANTENGFQALIEYCIQPVMLAKT